MQPKVFWYLGMSDETVSFGFLSTTSKTVTPVQPANFLFKIESNVGQGAEYIGTYSLIQLIPW